MNRSISQYWLLLKRVASISFASMLVYRSNVIFFFIFESFFLVGTLTGLFMGLNFAGGTLAGWSLDQVMFVAMLHQVGHQLFTTFCISGLFHIGFFVWSGRMDYVLLKPLHPLIGMHAANEFIISNVPNLVVNTALFVYYANKLYVSGTSFALDHLLWLFIFFCAGMAVRYGLALLVTSPAFLAEKLSEGEDAYWGIQSLAKYPSGVFPKFLQNIFTFVLPVATIAAIPADVFFGKVPISQALIYLSIALGFSYLCVRFFEWSSRRYQSVNTGA